MPYFLGALEAFFNMAEQSSVTNFFLFIFLEHDFSASVTVASLTESWSRGLSKIGLN